LTKIITIKVPADKVNFASAQELYIRSRWW